jgi:hypothetical protein
MTDQRLRELLEERVADLSATDLVSDAWDRASAVRRRRRALVGVTVAVVAIVGATTAVVAGNRGVAPPPPATSSTAPGPVPQAERAGEYAGVPVWWAPSVADEPDLPALTSTALPPEIDLSGPNGPVPAGTRAVALFQSWDEGGQGAVTVVAADGGQYSVDVSRLTTMADETGNTSSPASQDSLSPDGRYAFFAQERSLEVYDFGAAGWHSIHTRRWSALGAQWSVDGTTILLRDYSYSSPHYDVYSPAGQRVGSTRDAKGQASGSRAGDEPYGPTAWSRGAWGARGMYLKGPIGGIQSVDGIGIVDGTLSGHALAPPPPILAMRPESGGRWVQCCPVVGWIGNHTVVFESRSNDGRILAWRVGTPHVYRVSDIRGWTPGEESYVASFAAIDGSVGSDLADGGAYYFDQVRYIREVVAPDVLGRLRDLGEALPCAELPGIGGSPTTALVRGRIVEVAPGDAKIYGADEEDLTYADDFYDPRVNERNVVVTVDVSEAVTDDGTELGDTVDFRVGVIGGGDPRRFMDSLASMGDVAVLLSTYPDGRPEGEYYPGIGGAGLGLLDEETGQVRFSGFGDDEEEFVGPLDTVDALLDASRESCGL